LTSPTVAATIAGVDQLMREPRVTVVETGVPLPTAIARLARSLPDQPRIEPATGTSTDRRIIGEVDGVAVHLAVWDANVLTRRKSWNIKFDGVFESTPSGAVLKGAIDIPDRTQLNVMMSMFRIAGAFVAILALGLQIRNVSQGQPLGIWPAAGGILLAIFVIVAVRRMETEGGRGAEHDARALTTALSRLLRE
jgi:hypothetical protein